jgi:hypothetical protein
MLKKKVEKPEMAAPSKTSPELEAIGDILKVVGVLELCQKYEILSQEEAYAVGKELRLKARKMYQKRLVSFRNLLWKRIPNLSQQLDELRL